LSRYVLDTSAYSHFMRGEPEVVGLIDAAEWIGVPSIVIGELWTGFLRGRRLRENEKELRDFLANAAVAEIDVTATEARSYADLVIALRKAGTPVPSNDIWVAACAVTSGASVVTYDSHFRNIRLAASIVLER
jgi:tRNA(fMet)-specific endonuclease VapC